MLPEGTADIIKKEKLFSYACEIDFKKNKRKKLTNIFSKNHSQKSDFHFTNQPHEHSSFSYRKNR